MTDVSFNNPSRIILEAFAQLRNDKRFMDITQWLHDCMVMMALDATSMDDERRRNWEDGKVQAISNILTIVNESKERINRMDVSVFESKKTGAF